MHFSRKIIEKLCLCVLALVSVAFSGDNSISVLDTEAQIAFQYLNEFRQNPAEYGKK